MGLCHTPPTALTKAAARGCSSLVRDSRRPLCPTLNETQFWGFRANQATEFHRSLTKIRSPQGKPFAPGPGVPRRLPPPPANCATSALGVDRRGPCELHRPVVRAVTSGTVAKTLQSEPSTHRCGPKRLTFFFSRPSHRARRPAQRPTKTVPGAQPSAGVGR